MRITKCFWLVALGPFALSGGLHAVTPDAPSNQYQPIVERNLFNLKDAAPPEVKKSPEAPSPKVILTGVTTISGKKQAIMKVQVPGKPGEPAKDLSVMLGEGQSEENIEVLGIDEKTHSVRVNNLGSVATLTFEKDGLKNGGAVAAAPNSTNANPLATPQANTFASHATTNTRTVPTRGLKVPLADPALNASAGGNPANAPIPVLPIGPPTTNTISPPPQQASATAQYGQEQTSAINPANPAVAAQTAAAPVMLSNAVALQAVNGNQQKPLTAEEQYLLNELERERNANTGAYGSQPNSPVLAPTNQMRFRLPIAPQ